MNYQVSPGKSDWFVGLAATFFSAIFFCIPIYLCISWLIYILGFELANIHNLLFISSFVSTFFFLGKVQVAHMSRFSYWACEDGKLIRGRNNPEVLDLENVECMKIGLPEGVLFKPKYSFSKKRTLKQMGASVVILKMKNGQILLWRIYDLRGGRRLTEKVCYLLSGKLNNAAKFSDSELAIMKLKNLNRIITL